MDDIDRWDSAGSNGRDFGGSRRRRDSGDDGRYRLVLSILDQLFLIHLVIDRVESNLF